jgi:hypothetical protein
MNKNQNNHPMCKNELLGTIKREKETGQICILPTPLYNMQREKGVIFAKALPSQCCL